MAIRGLSKVVVAGGLVGGVVAGAVGSHRGPVVVDPSLFDDEVALAALTSSGPIRWGQLSGCQARSPWPPSATAG